MNKELRLAILTFVVSNEKAFQLTNTTIDNFRPYIYDSKGEYLIGGKEVVIFIENVINLLK